MPKPETALHATHQDAGAKLVDFAGWQMPIQYQGIGPEHRIVRNACGLFDLGHMGRLRVSGPGALAFLIIRSLGRWHRWLQAGSATV